MLRRLLRQGGLSDVYPLLMTIVAPHDGPLSAGQLPRWERRKERRPAELLEAALALFVERGYAGTRLDDIAASAGVSKGTLYLYFANKEELFKALVRQSVVPLLERFSDRLTSSDEPGPVLIEQFVNTWWAEFGSTKLAGLCKLIMAEAGNFPEVARFFHDEVIQPNNALVAGLIQRGIERGEFRPVDVEATAHILISPLVLKAIWAHSFEPSGIQAESIDPHRLLATHIQLIQAALQPPNR
jgi:AcrR family transcriptional regulator